MNDDLRAPIGQPLDIPDRQVPALPALVEALPAGAFTASLLFDLLSLVAENQEKARSYTTGAVDLLKVGLGASLASLALGLLDALKIPAASPAGKAATKAVALDGAVVAVYLLNLAARQKDAAAPPPAPGALDPAPVGLSLAGLALLAASGKLSLPRGAALAANVKKP